MKCEIISVGTEILLGDILNTNSRYLALQLAQLGIGIFRQTTVGDNPQRLKEAFAAAFEKADLVITTGGLGPTEDDLTKETAADFFDQSLVPHEPSLAMLDQYFKGDAKALARNRKQALFPEEAKILANPNGTAPGCILTKENKTIIVLPGPPKEMEPMFETQVKPYLEGLTGQTIRSRILRFAGIGEWDMAARVEDLCQGANPSLAPYAKDGECILRITALGEDEVACQALMEPKAQEVLRRLQPFYYGEGEETLNQKVPRLLLEKGLSIATAESLTGGLLASAFIDSELGISAIFKAGYVAYSEEAKQRDLGVSRESLQAHGAVSKQVAEEMVLGVQKRTGADVALATTGLAGPGGQSPDKPLGLTYVAIYYRGRLQVFEKIFHGSRNKLRARVVRFALEKLFRIMAEEV